MLLKLLLLILLLINTNVWPQSAEEVAKELANPNTTLGFMTFNTDYITYDGDLPNSSKQEAWRISFQPSLPYPIAEGVNFFLRPNIPFVMKQPVFINGEFSNTRWELGDIGFDAAVGKTYDSGMVLIGGVAGTLPTATSNTLGTDNYKLGPEFFLGKKTGWGFLGGLFTHQWDIAGGSKQPSESITAGQYFYTINLKNAWQIQAQPTWSYNHKADDSDDKLTLPLGIGLSKTIIYKKMPIKFSLQYWNYIESPDSFGPEHQIRFAISPVVPLPW